MPTMGTAATPMPKAMGISKNSSRWPMPYPASASVPSCASRPVKIRIASTDCTGDKQATAPTRRMSTNKTRCSAKPCRCSVKRPWLRTRYHRKYTTPAAVARMCPKATPTMPRAGTGPAPSDRAPPKTICKTAVATSANEGARMSPVPRTMEARVLSSQTSTAPANSTWPYCTACSCTAPCPPSSA